MAAEYSQQEINDLYESDQSKLYSGIMNHHKDIKSEESKAKVKRIVKTMVYLAVITGIEVTLGLWDHHQDIFNHGLLSAMFLCMTVLKAYLIVDIFMHLGDEFSSFIKMVLIPLILLCWAIVAFLGDGHFWLHMNNTRANTEQVAKPLGH